MTEKKTKLRKRGDLPKLRLGQIDARKDRGRGIPHERNQTEHRRSERTYRYKVKQ